jgi:hypothetical protein
MNDACGTVMSIVAVVAIGALGLALGAVAKQLENIAWQISKIYWLFYCHFNGEKQE